MDSTQRGSKSMRNRRRLWVTQNGHGILFVLPAIVLYLIFFIIPFFQSIHISLTSWNGVNPEKIYIGLDNYLRLIKDDLMWKSLGHNFIWVIVGTISPIVIGLLLAVLLSGKNTRGRTFLRTVYFMPVMLSPVVVGIIWGWVYNPIYGMLNKILDRVGLDNLSRGWLGDPQLALYMVLITAIWSYFGFCLVILMAGMQKVDTELYDAANIDGANSFQRFFHVTIPQLGSVLTMIIAYTLIGGLNVFDIVYVMTGGGPANSTELIATYTYEQSFQLNSVGYGASLSMVMTILSLVASTAFLKFRAKA
jgi:multiple sugar transport system permease protein/raffinose/stachyose/melibiose transport system permease protein